MTARRRLRRSLARVRAIAWGVYIDPKFSTVAHTDAKETIDRLPPIEAALAAGDVAGVERWLDRWVRRVGRSLVFEATGRGVIARAGFAPARARNPLIPAPKGPTCSCGAYGFPHRRGGGRCRFPLPPAGTRETRAGRHPAKAARPNRWLERLGVASRERFLTALAAPWDELPEANTAGRAGKDLSYDRAIEG